MVESAEKCPDKTGLVCGLDFFSFGPVSPRLNKSFSSLRMDGVVIFSVKHENWGQMSPLL